MRGLASTITSTSRPTKPSPTQNRRGGLGIVMSETLNGDRSKGSNGVYRRPMRGQLIRGGWGRLFLLGRVPVLGSLGGQLLGGPGALDHGVDEAVLDRLLGRHEEVPLQVPLDLLGRLVAVLGVDAHQLRTLAQDLAGVDLEVGSLALHPRGPRLVNQDRG